MAMQTEKDADEPRPAPIGRVDRALRLNEGLITHTISLLSWTKQGEES